MTAISGLNWKSRPNTEANESARLPRPGRQPPADHLTEPFRQPGVGAELVLPGADGASSCKWRITFDEERITLRLGMDGG